MRVEPRLERLHLIARILRDLGPGEACGINVDRVLLAAYWQAVRYKFPRRADGSTELPKFPGWFTVARARTKLLKGHRPFLDRLMADPTLAGLREGE